MTADRAPSPAGEPSAASTRELRRETMLINMGPQHPSTHGVLRLLLELDGETVLSCTPDRRLPAHRDREEHRVPDVAAGRDVRDARRLPLAVLQRGRVLPRGREAARDRGPAAGPGVARAVLRDEPHRVAPGLARHLGAGARRRQRDALRVPRARADPRHLRGRHRSADEPRVRADRRRRDGSARRRPRPDRRLPPDDAGPDRRVRVPAHPEPDLDPAQPRRGPALGRGCPRVRRHGPDACAPRVRLGTCGATSPTRATRPTTSTSSRATAPTATPATSSGSAEMRQSLRIVRAVRWSVCANPAR